MEKCKFGLESIIRILFLILILGIVFLNLIYFKFDVSNIFLCSFSLLAFLFIISILYRKKIIDKRIFYIVIFIYLLIGILLRIYFIENISFSLNSDFELYYNTASSIFNNTLINADNYYLSFNGYVYIFSSIISIFFKLFGESTSVVLYANLLFQLISIYFLYKIISLKFQKETASVLSISFFLLPTIIFSNLMIATENFFIMLFLITVYYLYKIIDKKDFKLVNILLFIGLGFLMSLSNNIRPVITVFVIALIIYFILKMKKVREILFLIITLFSYQICNMGFNEIIENNIGTEIRSGALGWSIYFGANSRSCGSWTAEDSAKVFEILADDAKGNKDLIILSIERLKENGIKNNIYLFGCKYKTLWTDNFGTYPFVNGVINYETTSIDFSIYEKPFEDISRIIVILLCVGTMVCLIYEQKNKKDYWLFIELFGLGYILSNLLVFLNGRYNIPLYPILIICCSYIVERLLYGNLKGSSMKEKISKLVNVYKKYGFIGFCKKLYAYVKANYMDKISFKVMFNKKKYHNEIKDILVNNKYDRIILWRSSFGYNVPLFQRPQHIANNLAKNNCLVFYEVTTMTDNVKTLKKHTDNIYLINFNNKALNKILMQELEKISKPKYVQLYSTDWKLSVENIKDYMNRGFGFIYEYIDDISPELAGTKNIPQNIIDKYDFVMNNKDVYVVVTADALEKDVIKHRGKTNLAFSSNGVDYNFFKTYDKNYKYEKEFSDILKKKKPIIMYYGALAKWFDYELVKKLAETDKYSIVLFGIKYDESFDENLSNEENIYFMGPRDYKVLKNYAKHADVLTIPFVINNITMATSPVKIFEYMALHKPIVTTDMPECRKYKSVFIGKSHDDFIKKVESALKKEKDKKYVELLDKEAKENDWSMKAKAIIDLIKKDEK